MPWHSSPSAHLHSQSVECGASFRQLHTWQHLQPKIQRRCPSCAAKRSSSPALDASFEAWLAMNPPSRGRQHLRWQADNQNKEQPLSNVASTAAAAAAANDAAAAHKHTRSTSTHYIPLSHVVPVLLSCSITWHRSEWCTEKQVWAFHDAAGSLRALCKLPGLCIEPVPAASKGAAASLPSKEPAGAGWQACDGAHTQLPSLQQYCQQLQQGLLHPTCCLPCSSSSSKSSTHSPPKHMLVDSWEAGKEWEQEADEEEDWWGLESGKPDSSEHDAGSVEAEQQGCMPQPDVSQSEALIRCADHMQQAASPPAPHWLQECLQGPGVQVPVPSVFMALLSADSAALGVWQQGGQLALHKVLTGYTTRRCQGRSQTAHERGGGARRSTGAKLRAQETQRLWCRVSEYMNAWQPHIAGAARLFSSGDARVWSLLYSSRPAPCVNRHDVRWQRVGRSVPRPRLRDLLAAYTSLSYGMLTLYD